MMLLLLAALLTPGACDRKQTTGDTRSRRAGNAIFLAVQDDAKTLDPHIAADAASMRLIENLYSTLLRYAPTYGEVEPDLAERYDVSPDGRVHTFHLRQNARFHSGREVTADDVKYSWNGSWR
jgi:peptide/nickel transport system substrate-binding protein